MTAFPIALSDLSAQVQSIADDFENCAHDFAEDRFGALRKRLLDLLPKVHAVPISNQSVRDCMDNLIRIIQFVAMLPLDIKRKPNNSNFLPSSSPPCLATGGAGGDISPSLPPHLLAGLPSHKQCHERTGLIQSTIVVGPRKLSFKDVSGLVSAKQSLREAIIIPSRHPQFFGDSSGAGRLSPWQCLLLYGPPGTGKSRLAEAVAGEIDSVFYRLSSADLISSFVGESEKLIRELFDQALLSTNERGAKPAIIFIDEVDSLCRSRNARETEGSRRVKTELMVQMQRLCEEGVRKVYLLCATNCPWELDSAFIRRFQKRIYIPLPKKDDRIQLLKYLNVTWLNAGEWAMIGDRTEGYSGCDLVTLSNEVKYAPIRQLTSAQYWLESGDGKFAPCSLATPGRVHITLDQLPANSVAPPRRIDFKDFDDALVLIRPTVSGDDLQRFERFTNQYGGHG